MSVPSAVCQVCFHEVAKKRLQIQLGCYLISFFFSHMSDDLHDSNTWGSENEKRKIQ